jgi:hypothetical protein
LFASGTVALGYVTANNKPLHGLMDNFNPEENTVCDIGGTLHTFLVLFQDSEYSPEHCPVATVDDLKLEKCKRLLVIS